MATQDEIKVQLTALYTMQVFFAEHLKQMEGDVEAAALDGRPLRYRNRERFTEQVKNLNWIDASIGQAITEVENYLYGD